MAGRHRLILALVVMAVAFAGVEAHKKKDKFGECSNNKDCGPLSCCTVGRMRYSIPTCAMRRGLGSRCIKDNPPFSDVLHYPSGLTIEIEEAYRGICPCQLGLVCLQGICQKEPDDDYYDDKSYNDY